jgi:ribosomal protein S18 acetylase RimI-like enzyme
VIIRKATREDLDGIMEIALSLHPRWFDSIAIDESIPRDLGICRTHVAEHRGRLLGFITDSVKDDRADIKWIGVEPDSQRKGTGSKLYTALENRLTKEGVREVRVDTVSERTNYEPYERTRAFYEKMGFSVERVRKIRSEETGEEFYMATYLKTL